MLVMAQCMDMVCLKYALRETGAAADRMVALFKEYLQIDNRTVNIAYYRPNYLAIDRDYNV